MAEQKKNKLGANVSFWCYKSDVAAFEALCAQLGLRWGPKGPRSAAHAILRAVARGDVALVPLAGEELERTVRTLEHVVATMSVIEPTLAAPLGRIARALSACTALREEYQHSKEHYREPGQSRLK